MIEIERKFLVRNTDFLRDAVAHYPIKQGFLSTDPARCVRVRIKGESGYLTIKGKGDSTGRSRFEWEKPISLHEAQALLALCLDYPIEKIRYEVPFQGHIFEVDVFENHNNGLIIAEIELSHPEEHFGVPNWLGAEVTGQKQYYNSSLSEFPYCNWEK